MWSNVPRKVLQIWSTKSLDLPEFVEPTMRALKGILLGFIAVSVVNVYKLLLHYVHLQITDDKDMAVHIARTSAFPFEFKLDPVIGVHEARAPAMHRLIRHGAQIDQKPKVAIRVELSQIHVLLLICCLHKEAAYFLPHILAFDAFVVQPVG